MDVSLRRVAEHLPGLISVTGGEAVVSEITHDSRQVQGGTLFVAITGEQIDGHDFIDLALGRGASALLVEREGAGTTPQIVVRDSRIAMAWAARAVFRAPDTSMRIAGVTGTNGKTTVVHMLESILQAASIPSGIIGTLGARIDGRALPSERTTPEATDLQRVLGTMRDRGVEIVVMEVSSHALVLHRSDAIHFTVVGFTNLSQDHLDFHGDMESYFEAKKRLFRPEIADRAVLNVGDPWGSRLEEEVEMPHTNVSIGGGTAITASEAVVRRYGTSFTLSTPSGEADVTLPLMGEFNVVNALVATGMALDLGTRIEFIAEGLSQVPPIPGRMEVIRHGGPFTVIVDYAHTPDAIGVVLRSVRPVVSGRLITVVGAGGDRDSEKRPLMGRAVATWSDLTIITTDNPRTENPASIAAEVHSGADIQTAGEVVTLLDRRDAIARAVSCATDGDVVLILGKGHEQGQDVGGEVLPFDDRDQAREALVAEGWELT